MNTTIKLDHRRVDYSDQSCLVRVERACARSNCGLTIVIVNLILLLTLSSRLLASTSAEF